MHEAPRDFLIAVVRFYRFALSPWLGSACRFQPTCSAYALEALQQRGAVAGAILALARVGRCHPWCAGGHDPVPLPRGRGPGSTLASAAPPQVDSPVGDTPCPTSTNVTTP